jgi:hypothetical protein
MAAVVAPAWAQSPDAAALTVEQITHIKASTAAVLDACLAPRFKEANARQRRSAFLLRNIGLTQEEMDAWLPHAMGNQYTGRSIGEARKHCLISAKGKFKKAKREKEPSDATLVVDFLVKLACGNDRSNVSNAAFSELLKQHKLNAVTVLPAIEKAFGDAVKVRELIQRSDQCLSRMINDSGEVKEQRFGGQVGGEGRLSFRLSGREIVAANVRIRELWIGLNPTHIEANGRFILTGKAKSNYIRFEGQIKSGGKWVLGSYSGTINKKRVRGRFSAGAQ